MPIDDSFQLASSRRRPQQENIIDLKKIFSLIFSKWYYFLITLSLALICAFLYNTFSIPTYRISGTILINEKKERNIIGKNQVLEGFSLGEVIQNLDNQIMILSSKTLIKRTLDELPFDIECYKHGLINKMSLYPNYPVKIVPVNVDSLPRDIKFTLKYINGDKFDLDAQSKDTFKLHRQASFGEIIKTQYGSFHIDPSSSDWPVKDLGRKIHFTFYSPEKLLASYSKRLKVEKASRTGTVVILSLEGTNKKKDIEFLNKLAEIFLTNSLDKKNQEAVRTIQFIDDQLIGISDSLVITENKLQQFRSQNRVMNLSAQGQSIIEQAMNLENEKARLGIEANYYSYLADYLVKDNAGQAPIAPATMGITDPGLTKLVTDLSELQAQYYSRRLGERNPLQSQLAQRVSNTKEALRETLDGIRRANNIAINENQEQIRTINAQASALPITERQLLGIERKYKLNDELYTFLLEKRADAQIQKASNMPDNELIDPPQADSKPQKPKKLLIYVLALMAGIGIPSIWILFADTFDDKIKEDSHISNITDIAIYGHIPHSTLKNKSVFLDDPDSHIVEAFRSLRNRMQLLTKEVKSPVMLITSSMPEEGKTFSALNLATAFSLIGKKTVLVGFDLRKPQMYSDHGPGNDKGVSTFLSGNDTLQDIITETSFKNLFLIISGPVPSNPSELFVLEKTDELISLLKERFECIIIDSSPIGTVSDTFHLASLSDASILIIRHNVTLKNTLENTLKELRISNINNIRLVVNDIRPDNEHYGYGGRHGHKYAKKRQK